MLQAGTAVLVDAEGTPRVRCKCGNPLAPPEPVEGTPKYTGTPWPDFNPQALAAPPGTDLSTDQTSPTPPSKENLIKEGGFEGGIGSWGLFQGNANAQSSVSTDEAHTGSGSLQIVNSSPFAPNVRKTMSQSVIVTKGTEYCLVFWAKTQNAQAGVLPVAVNAALSDRVGLPPGTQDWTQQSKSFVTEGTSLNITIITENTGTAWIDDVALTEGAC